MKTDKQQVENMLLRLPDDSALGEIQYHLYVLDKIRKGRADIATRRSHTHGQASVRLGRWLRD